MPDALTATRTAAAVIVLVLFVPTTARAEHCHDVGVVPVERDKVSVGAEAAFEMASFDNARYSGDYQGLAARLFTDWRWLHARAFVPYYWLTRNGLPSRGLGDAGGEVLVRALSSQDQSWLAGTHVAATVPTGSDEDELGMGHTMTSLGLWGAWHGERVQWQTEVSYARALTFGDSGHAHHAGGTRPLVSPMNMSEVGGALSARYRAFASLDVHAGVYGAVPVADDDGRARAIAHLGVTVVRPKFRAGIEGHVPWWGDPFTAKASISLGTSF